MPLISHDTAGDGPAVLLLHAGVADRGMWDAQRPLLAKTHRVIRVDLRGYGDSPLPPHPYDHVEDAVAVLDALGVPSAAVVGASFGGRIAQDLALRHPHRVERLVLLNPASTLLEADDELGAFEEREEALLDAGDLDGATALNVATWCGPDADGAARAHLAAMQRRAFDMQTAAEDLEVDEPGDPAGIRAPTLVVAGGHDLRAFHACALALQRAIPGAEYRNLPWAGHLPALERPDELGALLSEALRPR
ncbi:pimeloyl-ACP methyl ester carboxylesterase [Murinocardiopsis flavida]|uniref:Pimeloyl-ACP methyl ester carboxylesterase n=1 Tax=Murinocardiopsis flavida TaxID=645275 RepID=A0A2P8DMC8_9ACTN|nr:alpha/beta fold hydrolase [Murinocardiopsis flavida]PSK98368.1 pimeloyl-ACP methyl ester carboxylesterase [Murinocardiopsis flavida]